jgi:hypothetical protein
MSAFTGVKVFAATLYAQRLSLGEEVTRWLEHARETRPGFKIVDMVVRQSSDAAYHCISIIITYRDEKAKELSKRSCDNREEPLRKTGRVR